MGPKPGGTDEQGYIKVSASQNINFNLINDQTTTPDGDTSPLKAHSSTTASASNMSDFQNTGICENFAVEDVLSTISEAVYVWNFSDDLMYWAPNADKILGISDPNHLMRGSAYALLIDPKYISQRYDTILKAQPGIKDHSTQGQSAGITYRTKYRLLPNGRTNKAELWVEEYGKWFMEGNLPKCAKGAIRVINEHYEEEQRLTYYSKYDEVTGLYNRFQLIQEISHILSNENFLKQNYAFVVAAIDNLKILNENFGFTIGDEVLSIVGTRLRAHMREMDIIGRMGSNKFGILLHECAEEELKVASSRLIRVIRDNIIETSKGGLATSISMGAVLIPSQAKTLQQILSLPLEALNSTKNKYNRNFVLYEPSEARKNRQAMNSVLVDEIVKALNDKRMCLALQPVVDAHTNDVSFYECLLRMRRPDGAIISAGEFIAVAEQLGISRLIDHCVLELAIDLIKTHELLKISVNISGLTAKDSSWLETFRKLTNSDPEITKRIIIEITETSAIYDIEKTVEFVNTLKAMGCLVAIDDFGAGYTSFKLLKLLNVDIVKIDGEFVRNLRETSDDKVFVKTLTELAQNFNMQTVAEWVSDSEAAEMLNAMGINHCQGYLYGKPKLVEEFDEKSLQILPPQGFNTKSNLKA